MDIKEFILAKCLKGQSDIEIITEKDYISQPKPNGYRSLHLTIRLPVFFAEKEIHVPVEIQLRTIAMDFWASLEHTIRYKKNLPINTEIETELKECADSSREWNTKMERLLHLTAAFLYALRGASHGIASRDFVCHKSPNHSRNRLPLWGRSPQSPERRDVYGERCSYCRPCDGNRERENSSKGPKMRTEYNRICEAKSVGVRAENGSA